MTYKVVDTWHPCYTTTAPQYAVYRKRKLFGWKIIGWSYDPTGDDIVRKDFESHPHNEGEWMEVMIAKRNKGAVDE